MSEGFRHVDSTRTIVFGPAALAEAEELLGDGYTLLTTARAQASAPEVAARAASVVEVPPGLVEEVAAELRDQVRGERLVALGGGLVIDVAKALAAADPPRTVAAIPTSLSGAEMTGHHRHARGVPASQPRVRPALVVNTPALSASQPLAGLAASSANALGHALVGLTSERATPISAAVAREAAATLAAAWTGEAEPDRPRLALGALLAGWAIDRSGLGPHHALAQTAARTAGLPHGEANASLLPETLRSVRRRRPEQLEALDALVGVELELLAERLRRISRGDDGGPGAVADEALLERLVEAAAVRPELGRTPPAPDRAEIRQIFAAAGIRADSPTHPDNGGPQ
ncbi:MAG: iron-containing alcohol dehydrogenase [Actinobacteria bacterium]|nr:iron-containing alcohol dehydrogenase [Actinomycetota bacterium]